MGIMDSDGCFTVKPTIMVVSAVLVLVRNCLIPPHLLSIFSCLENSTENRVLGEKVDYRPDFEKLTTTELLWSITIMGYCSSQQAEKELA